MRTEHWKNQAVTARSGALALGTTGMLVGLCLGFASCGEAPEEETAPPSESTEQALIDCSACKKENCQDSCKEKNGSLGWCSWKVPNCPGGFEDPKDPKPPTPGGPGGANPCPIWSCAPVGNGKAIAAVHVYRTEVSGDPRPGRRPDSEEVPYTRYTYAYPQWSQKVSESPGCFPQRCCDKISNHEVPGHAGEFNRGQKCQN